MILFALLGAALAGPADVVTVDPGSLTPPDAHFPGRFDGPPVTQWAVDLPGGRVNAARHSERARPVIVGERVLVGSAAGRALFSVSRRDGSLLATFPADGAVESEAVVVDEQVYFADTAGTTWCYSLDGTLVWRHEGESPLPTRPTVTGDSVIVRDVGDLVQSLSRKDGTLQWQYRRKSDPGRVSELTLYAAPPPVVAGQVVLVGFSDGALVALDRNGGDPLWDQRLGEGRYPDLVAEPVVVGTTVFASGYLSPFVALDVNDPTVRWRVEEGAASAATVADTEVGRLLLHPGTDGVLRGIDPVAGDVRWSWDSGRGSALTEPVLTEAGVVVGSSNGTLALVDAASGELLWEYAGDRLLDGLAVAPVVDGRQMLFTTNAGRLHAMLVPQAPLAPPADEAEGFNLVDRPRDGWQRDR